MDNLALKTTRSTLSLRAGSWMLAALLAGTAASGEVAVSHLPSEVQAVKLAEAGGGAIRFSVEARIGDAGDWMLGARRRPGDPAKATAHLDVWKNGVPVPFILRFDGRRTVTLTMIDGARQPELTYEGEQFAAINELFVSPLAASAGTHIALAGLRFDEAALPDPPAAAGAATPGQDVLRIRGGAPGRGFTLTGAITLSWQKERPRGSDLRVLFWGATVPGETPASGVSITAPVAGSILSTGTPTVTALFSPALPRLDPGDVELRLDGAERTREAEVSAAGLRFTPPARLLEGMHTAEVIVRDGDGREERATVDFITDTVPPSLAFSGPPPRVTDNTSPVVRLTYGDATSGLDFKSLRVTLDGESIDSICVANLASGVCLTQDLAEGPHLVTATIRDRAGNSSTASLAFTLLLNDEDH